METIEMEITLQWNENDLFKLNSGLSEAEKTFSFRSRLQCNIISKRLKKVIQQEWMHLKSRNFSFRDGVIDFVS